MTRKRKHKVASAESLATSSINMLHIHRDMINPKKHPLRYQQCIEQLILRRKNGEFNKWNKARKATIRKEYGRHGGVLFGWDFHNHRDFCDQTENPLRLTYLIVFFCVNLVALAILFNSYQVKTLAEVHRYHSQVNKVECITEVVEHEDSLFTDIYYDVYVDTPKDIFAALAVDEHICHHLAQTPLTGEDVTIWHEKGEIYQISTANQLILAYPYMKKIIRQRQTEMIHYFYLIYGFIWLTSFKTLCNAVSPGRYHSSIFSIHSNQY